MAQLNADQAAALGSQLTGLPVAFVRALISEEGTLQGTGGGSNNPFDVTQTWAQDAGYGKSVNGQWNSAGVATFSDTTAAVQAWAYGINNFPNYTSVKAAVDNGVTSDFAYLASLFPSGYSGNSPTWASNVVSIASGLLSSGYNDVSQGTLSGTQQAALGVPQTQSAPSLVNPGQAITNTIQGAIPSSISQSFSSTLDALSSIGSSAATATQDVTQGLSDFRAIVSFLQDPALWTRFVVGVLGAILLLVGLVMFAASFIPKGSIPAVVPA